MAFTLDPTEPIGDEVRRVAHSQSEKLRDVLSQPEDLGIEESVHQARKRAKKLRALARLVRPALGDLYSASNEAFRDAARQLAGARDAHVLVETLDALLAALPAGVGAPDTSVVRRLLVTDAERIHASLGSEGGALARARLLAAGGAELIDEWAVEDDFEVIADGVAKTHRRLRGAWERAQDEPTVEAFHEWRKRAKYHRYHLKLLSEVYPSLVGTWTDELHRLTDALGDDHDLAVLTATMRSEPGRFGDEDVVDAVIVLAEGRGAVLREHALDLGARLAAEDTACVVDRLARWWSAASTRGGDPGATSLTDFAS